MLEISAVIIALNEEKRLARALESLSASPAIADEILVVDSGSTDRTAEIASRYGARVISHPWEGYARQKNFAASQAKHDWILSLDADEALSAPLRESLLRLKQEGPGDAAGYVMSRAAFYQGRWMATPAGIRISSCASTTGVAAGGWATTCTNTWKRAAR